MKRPVAIPLTSEAELRVEPRTPRAFASTHAVPTTITVESYSDPAPDPETLPVAAPKMGWLARLLWGTAGLLVSLGLGLGLNALIASLFAQNPWLGWVGLTILGLFLLALIAILIREIASLWRLRTLDHLKLAATTALATDNLRRASAIVGELAGIYAGRADLAGALTRLHADQQQFFDGGELLKFTERTLVAPLDARARALTAASARRVALVTTVSPRALVDIAFVVWESVRLGGAIARLYGARPGLWGTWRLIGAILGHLAVTGGLVLTDGVIEQLVGQGLAARLSQRLGEGVVNGLMTVRVGIAAMRVVRPLPFTTEPTPMVKDFLSELANVLKSAEKP
ncbi:MAG TPA: TIGR01620 family protein [Devosia sp.]|jgi:putative membrane protein|nr:TIGR01620 family protein [Devosia sp.]